MRRAFLLLLLVAMLLLAPPAQASDNGGSAPTSTVYSFRLPPAFCNDKPYAASGTDSDCTARSSRSQMREDKKTRPAQSWYGWSVCFPTDFAFGKRQTPGHHSFAYWHNHQCAAEFFQWPWQFQRWQLAYRDHPIIQQP